MTGQPSFVTATHLHNASEYCPAARSLPSLFPHPEKLVTIGGHKIHFLGSGAGSPTVVVEVGPGDFCTDGKNQKGTPGAIPLIVLTREHGGYQDMDIPAAQLEQEWLSTQQQLTKLSSNSLQILVPSGHQMHLEVPDVVASAIRTIVSASTNSVP